MKLHVFETEKAGQLFQAFTRDRSGKVLKNNMIEISKGGHKIRFRRHDWSYRRVVHFNFGDNSSEENQRIKRELFSKGVSVARVNHFPYIVYVYDAKYDSFDARIYSLDEGLDRFKHMNQNLELSPHGDFLGYDDLKYVGKLEARYYFELEKIGLNLEILTSNGFYIASTREVEEMEAKRRFLQRSLRRKVPQTAKELGIYITDLRVDLSPAAGPDTSTSPISVERSRSESRVGTAYALTEPGESAARHRSLLRGATLGFVGLAGFLASVATVLLYFQIPAATLIDAMLSLFSD